jgi:hypothetical protein
MVGIDHDLIIPHSGPRSNDFFAWVPCKAGDLGGTAARPGPVVVGPPPSAYVEYEKLGIYPNYQRLMSIYHQEPLDTPRRLRYDGITT